MEANLKKDNETDYCLIYQRLNSSFAKKLIYRINSGGGFYSEYNNILPAMLYCLTHKIRFVMSSTPGPLTYEKGWEDYFLPFCEEDNDERINRYNTRRYKKHFLKSVIYNTFLKFSSPYKYVTNHVWVRMHKKKFLFGNFEIKELGIDGNILDACNKLHSIVYRYTPSVEKLIRETKETLNLPLKYAGMHVRGGDKIREAEILSPDHYMSELKKRSECKDVFVLTDDYRLFSHLEEGYKDYRFYTTCSKEETGYFMDDLNTQDKKIRYLKYITLLVAMDVLKNAEISIGTLSANPGLFLKFTMPQGKFINIEEYERIWL